MPNSRGRGRYGSPVGKKRRGAVISASGNKRELSASKTSSSDTSWTDTSDTSTASTMSSKSSSSASSASPTSGTSPSSGSSSSTATSSSSSGSSIGEDSSCNEDSDDDEAGGPGGAGGLQRGRPRQRLIRFRHRREASVKCRHCGFKGYIASKECFFCGSATSHLSSGRTSKEPCGAVEELCNLLEVATLPEDNNCSTPTETDSPAPAPSPSSGRYVWSPCSSQSSGSSGSSSSTLSESGDWHLYLSDDEMEKDTSPRKQSAPAVVSLDD